MSQAITRCPDCGTSFRVTEAQLFAADGSVRCGACLNVFQAEDYFLSPMLDQTELLAIQADYWADFELWLTDMYEQVEAARESAELDEGAEAEAEFETSGAETTEVTLPEPPLLQDVSGPEQNLGVEYAAEPDSEPAADSDLDFQHEVFEQDDVPDPDAINIDVEHDPHHLMVDQRRIRSWAWLKWTPAVLLTVGLLGLQYAWFNMSTYAQDERYRDYYLSACRLLPCEVPVYRNPDELSTRELVIRSHPDESAALIADVLLRNDSVYRQLFPDLRLRFYDIQGGVVASRTFAVSDYLGGELRGLKLIPARTEVRLSLELVDPGPDALGYQIDIINQQPSL